MFSQLKNFSEKINSSLQDLEASLAQQTLQRRQTESAPVSPARPGSPSLVNSGSPSIRSRTPIPTTSNVGDDPLRSAGGAGSPEGAKPQQGALAESALSGWRRSLTLSRSSLDSQRPELSSLSIDSESRGSGDSKSASANGVMKKPAKSSLDALRRKVSVKAKGADDVAGSGGEESDRAGSDGDLAASVNGGGKSGEAEGAKAKVEVVKEDEGEKGKSQDDVVASPESTEDDKVAQASVVEVESPANQPSDLPDVANESSTPNSPSLDRETSIDDTTGLSLGLQLEKSPSLSKSLPDLPLSPTTPINRIPDAPSLGHSLLSSPSPGQPNPPEPSVSAEPSSSLPAADTPDATTDAVSDTPVNNPNASGDGEGWRTQHAKLEKIVRSLTPLDGISDVDAFEAHLKNTNHRVEMSMEEIRRLVQQLDQQKDRVDELRDTHRLETKSQSEQIDSLQSQLDEQKRKSISVTESPTAAAAQEKIDKLEADLKDAKAATTKAQQETEKAKSVAKEEEEKRTKSVSLLKALRQKLLKAEKEKEEAEKDRDSLKTSDQSAQEALRAEKSRADQENTALRAQHEQQLTKLRASFERESASIRAQADKEATARQGQVELDILTLKTAHTKELAGKDTRIQQLEATIRELRNEKETMFDQLQLRQGEIESSTSHQESLQGQTNELQYQLREALDREAAIRGEFELLRKSQSINGSSEAKTRTLLAEAQSQHEAKVSNLNSRIRQLEKERDQTEADMSKSLQDRLREVERMRQQIAQKDADYAESVRTRQEREARIEEAEDANREMENRLKGLEHLVETMRAEMTKANETEAAAQEVVSAQAKRFDELTAKLDEAQTREGQLRATNKTLREELRKVQSGVLQSERQRNPGVGFFSNYSASNLAAATGSSGTGTHQPRSSLDSARSAPGPSMPASSSQSPAPEMSSPGGSFKTNPPPGSEEAVNFEYIRNVIFQFLENKEMRPHLVQVLSIILHFTPQESRRLAAKASS